MSFQRSGLLCFWAVMVFFLWIGAAQAIVIRYEATDLPDQVAGEDLWRYTYTVSDHVFEADTGFTVYFDYERYGDIVAFEAPGGDWDILAWGPDAGLPDDGAIDALALTGVASPVGPFIVDFVWLGAGITPGPQPFELYFFDGIDFSILAEGTTAPVPEPATLLMVGSGLAGLAWLRRRRLSGSSAKQ